MKPGFQPTEEQEAIMASMRQSDSTIVTAYAGCAKTTTLGLASSQVKVPALALAFNKSIVKEFEGRFPDNFTIKTLNGLGHQAWARALPQLPRLELKMNKLAGLITEVSKGRKVKLMTEQWHQLRALVTGAMQAGLVPKGFGPEGTVPDTVESWLTIAEDQNIGEKDAEFLTDLARQILEEDIRLAKQGIISFDDQVYCPTMLGGKFPKFPVVFVDEAQDLSMLNHRMLAQCLGRPDAKLVAVGDPKQAIYAFRGADSESMSNIRQLRSSWVEKPLATTFRCPKTIVNRQQAHAPGFRAHEKNVLGLFVPAQQRGQKWGWEEVKKHIPEGGKAAVLCRNNGPLLGIAFKLIRQQIGVVMLGREIGKGLQTLSKKLASDDEMPAAAVAAKVQEWSERECALALANGKEHKIDGIQDQADCLQAVLAGAECRDAKDLRQQLEQLFAREHGVVVLSSIHKSKGLEWDLVLHLDPWRLPSQQAKKAAAAGDDRALKQEWNLKYVAETRTKQVLMEARMEDFQ